jgi:hypothetical protein
MDRRRVLGMFGAALLVLLGVRGDASDGKAEAVKPAPACCCGTACCCGDACADLCCSGPACCCGTCCCNSGDAASSMTGKVVS